VTAARPLVSIVIPVFNGANYLHCAIESALSQSYERVEVIVVNDGSTDRETERIARSYGERIRYYAKPNGGVASALNQGISVMRGEYFCWLSHDDVYLPEKVARQIAFAADNSSAELIGSGFYMIDQHGQRVGKYAPESLGIVQNGRDVMDGWVHGCSLLLSRDVFRKIGMFNEQNQTTQDLEYWLKSVRSGRQIYVLPEPLCERREHPDMGTYRLKPQCIRDIEHMFEELLSEYPIEFFRRDGRGRLTNRERAEIYDWLGEQARHRGASRMAGKCFAASVRAYANPWDPLFRVRMRKVLSGYKRRLLGRAEGDARGRPR
jgi:glycosyltransferase involved in cell wall biosynthesis